jgi:hypothetical protein
MNPRRRTLMLWAALAVVNLAAGVVISSHSERIRDLESIMHWGGGWLIGGENIYRPDDSNVDYPPNGMVLLSPLSLLPLEIAVPVWVLFNIALACLAPYLTARFFRPHAPFRIIVLPILMFLCWGGVRTLSQFSLLALTLSVTALVLADRRPKTSGAWIGLAMMKPQVAVPVFLWALFTRRWRVCVTSVLVAGALLAVFCLRAQANPVSVLTRYAAILAMHHTGDAILSGLSEMRPLIREFTNNLRDVDAIAGSIALGLLAAICVVGFQEGAVRARVLYAAPPLASCWILLSVYHLTYGFIVLLPVLMFLALSDAESSRLRKTLFWILQLGMMFDVPGISRHLGLSGTALYETVLIHADRALIVVLLAGLVSLAWREPPEWSAT